MVTSENKANVMEMFLGRFGCPQTVVDRLAAYTAGAATMLDFVVSLEQNANVVPTATNIVPLCEAEKDQP